MTSELLGGALIGTAAALLWLGIGRISGMTGVISSLFSLQISRYRWALWFLAGVIIANPLYRLAGGQVSIDMNDSMPLWLTAGVLVGFGTYIGNGCTSGHGVCGIGRFSPRSIVSTVTFIVTGMITVTLMNGVAG
ncbi:YeeE/YedE family protein [Gynuella sunshinyii]|uniref:Putative transporter component n=1 Tax=Gynuella sunshinyii YC6258 TaxID=1445510 RepID=A0A0C5VI41_9GAMM|nr:YeeE/YedE thiosulfate transporter family protein [Gynuella sunshinyii]AJQ93941.1 putative transporter component [Gynuella sunshinyii YC6258]